MKFEVTKEAAQWYVRELGLKENQSIKFFGKVYGTRNGFSFALSVEEPTNAYKSLVVEGIQFYIEKTDQWFFDDINLKVDLEPERNEPYFYYEELVK